MVCRSCLFNCGQVKQLLSTGLLFRRKYHISDGIITCFGTAYTLETRADPRPSLVNNKTRQIRIQAFMPQQIHHPQLLPRHTMLLLITELPRQLTRTTATTSSYYMETPVPALAPKPYIHIYSLPQIRYGPG